MMRSENKYCLQSESRWKVKQSSQSEVLWSAGSTEELAMTTGNFSPSLLCWKIKTCPSLMAEAILPASTKKKMSKLSGNSNHSNLEVHQCFGDISFNAESSRPSLDDSNCDNPFAQAPAKAHMPSPHVLGCRADRSLPFTCGPPSSAKKTSFWEKTRTREKTNLWFCLGLAKRNFLWQAQVRRAPIMVTHNSSSTLPKDTEKTLFVITRKGVLEA